MGRHLRVLLCTTTSLSMGVSLLLPVELRAQGELSSCRAFGVETLYPCTIGERVVRGVSDHGTVAGSRAPSAAEQRQLDRAEQRRLQREEQRRLDRAEQRRLQREEQRRLDRAEQRRLQREEQRRLDRAEQRRKQRAAEEALGRERDSLAARSAAREAARQAQRDAERQAQREAERQAQREALRQAQREQERQAARQAERRSLADQARRQREANALAERQAARQQARAAARANAQSEVREIFREDVSQGGVRRSSEEFDSGRWGRKRAQEATQQRDGLSKFETAILLGLGAVVVGSVLNNGDRVVSRSGDRLVVEDPQGQLRVLKNDDALLRRPGDRVQTERFNDGSSRTIVAKPDGTRVVTVRAADGTVLRRNKLDPQGRDTLLFDDTFVAPQVEVSQLPRVQPVDRRAGTLNTDALRLALEAELANGSGRRFSLAQIRDIAPVRALAPQVELDAVQFRSGSAAIEPEQARALARLGVTLTDLIARQPGTVFLIEGHTDAVGSAAFNLALSDRRAETVALALTEYFDVPPEHLVTQGYGESDLKVQTAFDEPANRRAVVRNITGLLR